jgi:hypothetical protein
MMDRVRVEPLNVRDAPIADLPPDSDMWVPGARRRVLAHDASTDAITYVSEIPTGYRRSHEVAYREQWPAGRFEHHACHEEGFILDGRYDFGGWYGWGALGYLNHPATWVHPADQCAPEGARLLMKLSGPLDFVYTDIPEDWDGREYPVDPDRAAPYDGVSSVGLARGDGEEDETGRRWRRLWHDPVGGWTTWLLSAPPGWQGRGDRHQRGSGDEIFLLAGDLTTRILGEEVALRDGDYACDPDLLEDGGAAERSVDGCLAVRWTR